MDANSVSTALWIFYYLSNVRDSALSSVTIYECKLQILTATTSAACYASSVEKRVMINMAPVQSPADMVMAKASLSKKHATWSATLCCLLSKKLVSSHLLNHLTSLQIKNIRPVDVMLPDFNGVDITIIGVVSLSHPTTMQSVANTKNASYADLCRQHGNTTLILLPLSWIRRAPSIHLNRLSLIALSLSGLISRT